MEQPTGMGGKGKESMEIEDYEISPWGEGSALLPKASLARKGLKDYLLLTHSFPTPILQRSVEENHSRKPELKETLKII